MYLNSPSHFSRRSRGSMLVLAIFAIVVLAFLALTIGKLLSSSTDSVVHEVLGLRALNAARTGSECRLASLIPANSSSPYCGNPGYWQFNNIAGLENCQYTTRLVTKLVVDGGINHTYYQITSTGQCTAGNVVVSRTINVDAIL